MKASLTAACVALVLVACAPPADLGAEPSLGPIEETLDPGALVVWPGQDDPDGVRRVPLRRAFFDGAPVSYWYGGAATRATADVFWFCRPDRPACPFDAQGVLDPSSAVGDPVFARIPGEVGYSPYWLVWIVTVPDDYQPDDLKSVFGIEQAAAVGDVEVTQHVYDHGGSVGPDGAVMNCLLVPAGTELEGNGAELAGAPGAFARWVPVRQGWHKQFRVHYFDFTEGEGVIPPDDASESRPQMPASDLYVLQRDCGAGSASPACDASASDLVPVSEAELGIDLDGDGDARGTNHLLAGFPGSPGLNSADRPYTALWRLMAVRVVPEHDGAVALLDSPGGSEVMDTATMLELIDAGWLDAPKVLAPHPGRVTTDEVLFNGAVQLPE